MIMWWGYFGHVDQISAMSTTRDLLFTVKVFASLTPGKFVCCGRKWIRGGIALSRTYHENAQKLGILKTGNGDDEGLIERLITPQLIALFAHSLSHSHSLPRSPHDWDSSHFVCKQTSVVQ